MREDTEDDDKDDGGGDPGPELVKMDDLVTEEGNKQRTESNDDNASVAGNIVVDGMNYLGADDRIHCRPAEAGKNVEHGDCNWLTGSSKCKVTERTDLDTVPAEPVSRQNHLSQPQAWSESGEVTHRDDSDEVEEQADQASICESEEEKRLREKADSER